MSQELVMPQSARGHSREALVIAADLSASTFRSLQRAAVAADLDVVKAPADGDGACEMLPGTTPRAIIMDMTSSAAPGLCAAVRRDPLRAHLPLIGVAPSTSDLSFADLFAWGGDDLVSSDRIDDLIPRLRSLRGTAPARSPRPRGRAVVADRDPNRRAPISRVLHGAGYEVLFVATLEELVAACAQPVALASMDLALALEGGIDAIAALTPRPVVVVSTTPREMQVARARLGDVPGVALYDAFTPPDNLLFLANELASEVTDRRTAPRLLHGTRIWMRLAGGEEDVLGYTFNVSTGGVFARTLHPFENGQEVWLEFSPPRSGRRVRLCATTVWRRPFGPIHAALSPAGVGFRLTGAMPGDGERFQESCAQLAKELGIVD